MSDTDPDVAATRLLLGDVELALYRMTTGRYGTCLYCGGEVALDRLVEEPYADGCADCGT
jgi:DnaK suppressor protein